MGRVDRLSPSLLDFTHNEGKSMKPKPNWKPKYRRGTRYMWVLTYSFNPVGYPPGSSSICNVSGSFVLRNTLTAIQMYNLVLEQAREQAKLPKDHPIFPSLYHVEEQYGMVR